MLYAQKQSVDDRAWAPGSSTSNRVAGLRPLGYADYRPGYYYISADPNLISAFRCVPPPPPEAQRNGASTTTAESPPGAQAGYPHFSPSCTASEGTGSSPEKEAYARWAVCWDWQNGHCNKGDSCKWLHVLMPKSQKRAISLAEEDASSPEQQGGSIEVATSPGSMEPGLRNEREHERSKQKVVFEFEQEEVFLERDRLDDDVDEGFLEAESEAEAFSPETFSTSTFSPGGKSAESPGPVEEALSPGVGAADG